MKTGAAVGHYDGQASNECRFEDRDGAIASGEALLAVWSPHPRLRRVDAYERFEEKIEAVREALRGEGPAAS
jgi:hypothetical protein